MLTKCWHFLLFSWGQGWSTEFGGGGQEVSWGGHVARLRVAAQLQGQSYEEHPPELCKIQVFHKEQNKEV